MLAKKYKSEIISIKNYLNGIFTVEFIAERGNYKFLPGQFLHLALDKDYDGIGQWPDSRCFSIQSPPNSQTIKITYSVKGDFTNAMKRELEVGCRLWLKLPYGELFQQAHDKSNTVFISGGTGITPYLSLFNDSSFEEYTSPKIYIGFRSEQANIYQTELNRLIDKNVVIKTFYENKEGKLDIGTIFNENGANASYFISGPPSMIRVFKQKLLLQGVNESNVLTDDWE